MREEDTIRAPQELAEFFYHNDDATQIMPIDEDVIGKKVTIIVLCTV